VISSGSSSWMDSMSGSRKVGRYESSEAERKGLRTRFGERIGLDERADDGSERTRWGDASVGEE
jgi:hypothetical protein